MAEATATRTGTHVGRLTRIPEGQGRCYVVGSEEIAIFRQRDGRVFATENRCPHRQGPLAEGVLGGGRIVCPMHGHQFDLETGAGSEPGECVRVLRVTQLDGDLFVDLRGGRE